MLIRSSKLEWHRIYYALAVFDVFVVLMSLYLTHQIIATFNHSVATNLDWERRLDRYLALGELAAAVNAPGNDVFDTRQVLVEANRTEVELQTFRQQMNELRTDARTNLNAEQAALLLKDLDAVDIAMNEMVAEARQIFALFRASQTESAGVRMASMDRTYHNVNRALANVRKDVSEIQRALFVEQQATTVRLQRFEFIIAGFVLLMIGAAAFYGNKIRQQLEHSARERERYITELQAAEVALHQANEELEQKVQTRTTELANANITLQAEIRERLRTEEQLRQAQKMEAVGRLAGGIAHDFNNILAAILGYCDLLLMMPDLNEKVQTRLRQIKKVSGRAAELTSQLLAFSRKQVLRPQIIDLNVLVVETEKLLRRLMGEDIEIKIELDTHIAGIEADPNQIQQVLINLAVNARDAMPQGGILRIETSIRSVNGKTSSLPNSTSPRQYVVLTVGDTGQGMDAETQLHIFEPFFTTKGQGKGTGLGLATVYGIVQQSDGFIHVQSTIGQGTTFDIHLPYTDKIVVSHEHLPATSKPPRGAETVLVVEDDATVRQMTSETLHELGYHVLAAANGDEAIALVAEQQPAIDLLLTDVIMPGMNGREVAERLTQARPNLRVLYMSGYANEIIGQHGLLDGKTWFLQKPFSIDTLAQKVREVLDAQ